MILLLLSFIVLVAQGLLGMASWWVLGSNCIVAGLISLGLTATLNSQRMIAFNHLAVGVQTWALLTSIMNLTAIHVTPMLPLWQVDLLALGFTAIFMAGLCCWQNKQMQIRSLLWGAILGLLTLCYIPSLIWIIFPMLILFYCMCWSQDNLACLLTGFLTMVWINFCILSLSGGHAGDYIRSFAFVWGDMTYGLPTFESEGYTRWIFVGLAIFLLFVYILLGVFASILNSLRMRSNVTLHVVVGLLLLALMPSCWQLYLVLLGIAICIDILLALGNESSRTLIHWTDFFILLVIVTGIGEYVIRLAIDFVSTISFSLPFDIPFFS